MLGGSTIVNEAPLLCSPPTVTIRFPDVAPDGAGTTICVLLQLVGVPAVPLNDTLLVPWVAPKLDPEMVTAVPSDTSDGLAELMYGFAWKLTPLLVTPATVTYTLP
jgi:hypothetical protein